MEGPGVGGFAGAKVRFVRKVGYWPEENIRILNEGACCDSSTEEFHWKFKNWCGGERTVVEVGHRTRASWWLFLCRLCFQNKKIFMGL